MHRAITLLIALVAAFALAAPTPKQVHSPSRFANKFTVPVRGRHGRHGLYRNPRQEIERVYRKFNWSITFLAPGGGLSFSLGFGDSTSSAASPYESVAAQPLYPNASSTAVVTSSVPTPTAAAEGDSSSFVTVTSVPTSTATASPQNENGEVSATPEENESEYLSPVSINGQTLNLDFDTGSADL
jgi:hypothetical protein